MRDPDELVKALDLIGHLAGLNGTSMGQIQEVAAQALASYREAKEGEYRILGRGEIVQEGDEFERAPGKWFPAERLGSTPPTEWCVYYRRPIRKEQP
jgi:hypothetical protein